MKNKFNWQDPLLLSSLLSDEENLISESATKFSKDVLFPNIVNTNRNGFFDTQIMREMGKLGFLGATINGYGCVGVNNISYGLIARAVEWVDSGYRSALSVQSSLVMHPIYSFGTDAQKEKYLPKLSTAELIGCFGLTESGAGSDPSSMTTRAVKYQNGYRITGGKSWITNSPIADILIIWAKIYNDPEIPDGTIGGFILERTMKGIDTPIIEGKMSLKVSITGSIMLDEVFVPAESRLQILGIKGAFSCLNKARFGIAWGVMGAAEFCYEAARNYTMERKQFNRSLASNQLIQKKLADMATEISLGLLSCLQVGRLLDNGLMSPEMISIIKRNSTAKALEIAREARDMHGGNGISDEYHVMRHLVNLESVNTYEGTSDIHALIIGRGITGLSAF
jgi:glutaryl-CoA dehydrogenase